MTVWLKNAQNLVHSNNIRPLLAFAGESVVYFAYKQFKNFQEIIFCLFAGTFLMYQINIPNLKLLNRDYMFLINFIDCFIKTVNKETS